MGKGQSESAIASRGRENRG